MEDRSIANNQEARTLAKEVKANRPDVLLLVMFYNGSLPQAELLLKAAEEVVIPTNFYIALGAKHMPVGHYRRPGVYFIQSLDNLDAIEYGLRMVNAKKLMSQSVLLSISGVDASREKVEGFFGTTIRVIPFARYAEEFRKVPIDAQARQLIAKLTSGAKEALNS